MKNAPVPKPTKTIPFTREKYEELQAELKQLLQTEKEVLIRLQAAREMGDLSENGAYQYAKIELGNTRRKLREVRHFLKTGYIVQKTASDSIQFGASVTLSNGQKDVTYTIVSLHESNPLQGKLSLESPLGQALAGKKVGDTVKVTVPVGEMTYTITKVA